MELNNPSAYQAALVFEKKMKLQLILLLFCVPIMAYSQSDIEWDYLNAPNTGTPYAICKDQNGYIYINTNYDIYRSSKDSIKWERIFSNSSIRDLFSNDSTIATCLYNSQLKKYQFYISINSGATWELRTEFDIEIPIKNILIDKNNNIYILFSNEEEGVVKKSTDLGLSWNKYIDDLIINDDYLIYRIIFDSDERLIVCGGNAYGKDIGIAYVANDEQSEWGMINFDKGFISTMNRITSDEIWIGSDRGLFISKDSGISWNNVDILNNIYVFKILAYDSCNLFLATEAGIFHSSDKGNSWAQSNSGLYTSYNRNIFKDDDGKLYTVNVNGFFYSTNLGQNWIQANDGFCASNISGIAFNKEDVYVSSYGVFKSTDNGENWNCIGLQEYITRDIICDNEGTILVDVYTDEGGLFRSTDDGESWEYVEDGLIDPYSGNYINITGFTTDKYGDLYLSAHPKYTMSDGSSIGGIMKSTDHGKTWQGTNFISGANYIAFNSEDHLFTGFYNDAIFRSTDYGVTWELVHNQTKDFLDDLSTIAFNPNSQVGIATGDSWDHLRTTDNGRTWYDESGTMLAGCFAVDSTGRFWAARSTGTSTGFLAYTTEPDGEWSTWHRAGMDLSHNNFTQVAVSPGGFIFAGARYGGLYKSKLSYVAVEEVSMMTPDLMLEQNIPNPFSDETEIRYSLADDCHVKLIIYDALGRETAILENAFREKGRHIIKFNTADLPSAIYLYRLSASGVTVSRQMQVIK